MIIKFLKKAIRIDNEIDRITHFKNGKEELLKLYENPSERVMQEYLDFIAWFDSQIDNLNFAEAIKRNYDASKA